MVSDDLDSGKGGCGGDSAGSCGGLVSHRGRSGAGRFLRGCAAGFRGESFRAESKRAHPFGDVGNQDRRRAGWETERTRFGRPGFVPRPPHRLGSPFLPAEWPDPSRCPGGRRPGPRGGGREPRPRGVLERGRAPCDLRPLDLLRHRSDFLSDPRIQYDGLSGRWFVAAGDFTTGQVLVAASKSVDPTLDWSIYRVPSSATSECLDQPILGVGTLNVIVSVNVYSNCVSSTYTYNGAQFWVINKTDLVNGVLGPSVWPSPRYAADFSIHPVRMEGRSLVQYMVATLWEANTDTSSALQLFEVSGSPPGAVVVSEIDRAVASAGLPPPSTQLGTAYTLDTADFRISDAVWSRGLLWLGFNDVCPGLPSTACVRLIELDTTARTIRQDFRLSSTSRHYFYPALALDGAGNLAVLAGYASGSEYPGLRSEERRV